MHNLVAVGLMIFFFFAGIGVMMVGLGIYYWGKSKCEPEKKS